MPTQALARVTPKQLVEQRMKAMVKALPNKESFINRFKQAAMAICLSPNIADCTPESVARSIYACARLGLIPDPILQQAHIVPFRNHGVKEATLIVGYKGLIALAKNADPGMEITVGSVYDGDDYVLEEGLSPTLKITKRWWAKKVAKGGLIFSYCIFRQGGAERASFTVLSAVEGEEIGRRSKAGSKPGTPWHDNFDAMCEKTTIRRSSRLMRLDPDKDETQKFRQAVQIDENVDGEGSPPDLTMDGILEDEPEDQPSPQAGEHRTGHIHEATLEPQQPPVQPSPTPAPSPTPPAPNEKRQKSIAGLYDLTIAKLKACGQMANAATAKVLLSSMMVTDANHVDEDLSNTPGPGFLQLAKDIEGLTPEAVAQIMQQK